MNEETPLNEAADAAAAEPVQQTPEIVAAPPSAGEQLKAAREARGWTVEQVANQLNLAARQIDALERDNYAALPGMVIVRGFIRTYAKLLQADAAPILAAIQGEAVAEAASSPARSVRSTAFSETQLKPEQGRSFPLKAIVAAIVVLGVGAFAVFQGQRMGWKTDARTQAAKTDETVAPIAAPETSGTAPAAKEAPNPSAAPAAAVATPEQGTTTVALPPASQPAPKVLAEAQSEAKPQEASAPAASGKNVLAIHAKQESWVEVRDAKEKVVFSSLLKAGASESVDLPGPVTMVVGNAAGVEVTLRGAPVDLKGNASNVARLNLK